MILWFFFFNVLFNENQKIGSPGYTALNRYMSGRFYVIFGGYGPNADLSSLSTSAGAISPTFVAATTSYSLNVSFAVSLISVTAVPGQRQSTIRVNGIVVESSRASQNISLVVGTNIISVLVTSGNTLNTRTYNITVTRPAAGKIITIRTDTIMIEWT